MTKIENGRSSVAPVCGWERTAKVRMRTNTPTAMPTNPVVRFEPAAAGNGVTMPIFGAGSTRWTVLRSMRSAGEVFGTGPELAQDAVEVALVLLGELVDSERGGHDGLGRRGHDLA